MLCLADFANDDGDNVYPSIESIAARTGLSESSVKRALKGLADSGDIELIGKHAGMRLDRATNEYRLNIERLIERKQVYFTYFEKLERAKMQTENEKNIGGTGVHSEPFSDKNNSTGCHSAVSYTHLTLPTNREV